MACSPATDADAGTPAPPGDLKNAGHPSGRSVSKHAGSIENTPVKRSLNAAATPA